MKATEQNTVEDQFAIARHFAGVAIRSHERGDAPSSSLIHKAIDAVDKGLGLIRAYREQHPDPMTEQEFADMLRGRWAYSEAQSPYYTQHKAMRDLRESLSAILRASA